MKRAVIMTILSVAAAAGLSQPAMGSGTHAGARKAAPAPADRHEAARSHGHAGATGRQWIHCVDGVVYTSYDPLYIGVETPARCFGWAHFML